MGFAEDAADKVKAAAEVTAKRTGELVGLGKANIKILEIQNNIEKLCAQIGKLVYNSSKGGEDIEDEVSMKISAIDELNMQMEIQRELIAEIKGQKRCASCGYINKAEQDFCGKCAATL